MVDVWSTREVLNCRGCWFVVVDVDKLVVGIVCRSMLVETAAGGGGDESSFLPPAPNPRRIKDNVESPLLFMMLTSSYTTASLYKL